MNKHAHHHIHVRRLRGIFRLHRVLGVVDFLPKFGKEKNLGFEHTQDGDHLTLKE
jgi:hypothetical protein